MKTLARKSTIVSCGLAMFGMFFGAGNIVYPLALGQAAISNNLWGILGMMITAVIVPLVGIIAMLTYEGDYNSFFKRIGAIPGFFLSAAILAVIGPFAGIPRCITISFSTITAFGLNNITGINLATFSILSCVIIFFFTYRPRKILSLVGYVLTPILLFSLAIIAIKGTAIVPDAPLSLESRSHTFVEGLVTGYHTMDLLAAFFFSSVVLLCLKQGEKKDENIAPRSRIKVAVWGGLIAAGLLTLVYTSFSFLAAGFSEQLRDIPSSQLLGTLSHQLLGARAGLVAGLIVAFACLTTEIALAAVFADYLHKTLLKKKLSYPLCVVATLVVAFLVSTLQFEGISKLLGPVLQVCYPALMVLTLLNLLNKTADFKPVKRIFYFVIALSLGMYFFL